MRRRRRMVRSELIKRSPLRIFEKSIHGGLGKGNIGILASKKGVGKTACLVHIATDKLLQDKHVIHVSFSAKVDHIINWYEDIFKEIAKKRNLESAVEVHDEIIRNRVIMNFNQRGMETAQVLDRINSMIRDGHFAADTIIFDGYDFAEIKPEDLELVREFAAASGLEIWFSVSLGEDEEELFDREGVPNLTKPFLGSIAVLITLRFRGDHIHFQAVKDHDEKEPMEMHLMLDQRTLLVVEE
jgi:hypothetical protein